MRLTLVTRVRKTGPSRLKWVAENSLKSIFKAARTLLFGGCRHKKMGWPLWVGGYAFRVCLDCGIKRLFDEERWRCYGSYSYHIDDLLGRGGNKEPRERQVLTTTIRLRQDLKALPKWGDAWRPRP